MFELTYIKMKRKSYNCSFKMNSTITGGASSILGNYSISSKGTLNGSYPGVNPAYCEKIKFKKTYRFVGKGLGSLLKEEEKVGKLKVKDLMFRKIIVMVLKM